MDKETKTQRSWITCPNDRLEIWTHHYTKASIRAEWYLGNNCPRDENIGSKLEVSCLGWYNYHGKTWSVVRRAPKTNSRQEWDFTSCVHVSCCVTRESQSSYWYSVSVHAVSVHTYWMISFNIQPIGNKYQHVLHMGVEYSSPVLSPRSIHMLVEEQMETWNYARAMHKV